MKGQRRGKINWSPIDGGPVLHAFRLNPQTGKFGLQSVCGVKAASTLNTNDTSERCQPCDIALKRTW